MGKKSTNRICVVLAEKERSNRWLAEKLAKTDATVSKWCTNKMQPSLETLVEIANALDVDVSELLNRTKKSSSIFITVSFPILLLSMTKKNLNRIKVVLSEKQRTNKWLAEKLHKNPVTISHWCSNISQPSIETLAEIARVLDVDIWELLNHTKEKN